MKFLFNFLLKNILFFSTVYLSAQAPKMVYKTDVYWQQQADYTMEIDMDVETFQYTGKQSITYTNNSPDVLQKVFFHLYFNAFQPGSEMDIRTQYISDPDKRLTTAADSNESVKKSRIALLKPNEIGFIKVRSLTQNGEPLKFHIEGTIMEVMLNKAIQPDEVVVFDMDFEGQVPLQIRRAGRNNKEGVALSMAQWYPKLAEYDDEGWHADSYIGKEFYGVWGNYDVKISIDKDYTIGGTGYLQNPEAIGHGYAKKTIETKGDKLTWHFIAPHVHDFAWAADPEYLHDIVTMENGPTLHFLYKKDIGNKYRIRWEAAQLKAKAFFKYFNEHVGLYPYEQYSIIQAGDGGMEYGMCTFITGKRSYNSLLGVIAHEIAHSWFQFVLATNESKHEWMDEGFTSYIEDEALHEIMESDRENPQDIAYNRYIAFANSGLEQPLTTHANRYASKKAYSRAAYSKGAVFLAQLGYVMGADNLKKTIKQYYKDYAFKHPKPMDFIRVAEKVSGLELDWYLIDFAQTTNTIDYAIKDMDSYAVILERKGMMPMPIDLSITYLDGSTQDFYIPLRQMRGEKPTSATILEDWAWSYPTYKLKTTKKIKSVEIDPSGYMADINRDNNTFEITSDN